MAEKENQKKPNRIKQFFSGLVSKIDKALEEKAKTAKTCCDPKDKQGNLCCK